MKRQIIWGVFFVGIFGILALGTSVYAAEEATTLTVELTEEEKQAKLAQIAQQLEEVKRELIHLSLLVTKLALEEQVLALEQQLLVAVQTEAVRKEAVPEGEIGIAMGESAEEQPQSDLPAGEAGAGPPPAEAGGEEDVFGAVSLEDQEPSSSEIVTNQEEDEEGNRGFLAALGPFRNLGTPELAALTILAILGLFILVRRFRKRKSRLTENVPMKVPEDQPESPQSQGSVFQ